MIAIIDYDAGNLKSVEKALQFLGQECVITRDFHEIKKADKVIRSGGWIFRRCHEPAEVSLNLTRSFMKWRQSRNHFWESVWDYSFCLKEVKSLMEWKDCIC